jgi:hypothetical protein
VVRGAGASVIVVTVMGGLGNQLFQYAFGRAMSAALDRRLVLDLTLMPTGAPPFLRRYELDRLDVPTDVVTLGGWPGSLRGELRARPGHARAGRLLRRALGTWWVVEPDGDVALLPEELPSRLAVCLGYWQSPGYFAAVADGIRRELTPAVTLGSAEARTLARLEGRETVAVHVRRGDYVLDASTRAVHGVQPASYYAGAVRTIAERTGSDLVALVLSDDPAWAQANLDLGSDLGVETVHVEADGALSSIGSLALMSRCTHHVIANSSFSWWGAWLAEHPGQHVVHPGRWFASREVSPAFRFPQHWTPHGS